jgi:hypothetical protein
MVESVEAELADRATRLLGWKPEVWDRVYGGYTAAARYRVRRGGDTAFVKIATTPLTAGMLRRELAAYRVVSGPYAPRFLGGEDHPTQPMLAIEDLGAARWPPPWTDAAVADALAAIAAMHDSTPALPTFAEAGGNDAGGWRDVERDPAPFLSLGLASQAWLEQALPALLEAEQACPTAGRSVAHFDIRSDNLCFAARGAVLVDWAEACLADPTLDLGGWLPSLAFEGGPQPEAILPDAPLVAAWVSGYFAAHAGLPEIADAPFVRRVQREQLSTALPWAQRALRLPSL